MAYREASLETKAPPARVWQIWSDVDTWPEWNPDMKESRLDGPLKLGTTGMINTNSGGRHDVGRHPFRGRTQLRAREHGHAGTKIGIRATVEPSGNGARISQAFEARGLLAPVVGPMMG